jgi:hypothetical protein
MVPKNRKGLVMSRQILQRYFISLGTLSHLMKAPQVRLFSGKKGVFSTECIGLQTMIFDIFEFGYESSTHSVRDKEMPHEEKTRINRGYNDEDTKRK